MRALFQKGKAGFAERIICCCRAVGFSSFWSMSRSASCITKLVIIVLGEGDRVLREKVEEDIKWERQKEKWKESVFRRQFKGPGPNL